MTDGIRAPRRRRDPTGASPAVRRADAATRASGHDPRVRNRPEAGARASVVRGPATATAGPSHRSQRHGRRGDLLRRQTLVLDASGESSCPRCLPAHAEPPVGLRAQAMRVTLSYVMATLTIRLSDRLRRDLEKLSEERGRPAGEIVRESLRRYLATERFRALRAQDVALRRSPGSPHRRGRLQVGVVEIVLDTNVLLAAFGHARPVRGAVRHLPGRPRGRRAPSTS